MELKSSLACLLLFFLDLVACHSYNCTFKLLQCTKMMVRVMAELEDKSSMCQVLDSYFNCIETNCVEYLSPCDTNKFRVNMLSGLKYCSSYVAPVTLDCFQDSSTACTLTWHYVALVVSVLLSLTVHRSLVI